MLQLEAATARFIETEIIKCDVNDLKIRRRSFPYASPIGARRETKETKKRNERILSALTMKFYFRSRVKKNEKKEQINIILSFVLYYSQQRIRNGETLERNYALFLSLSSIAVWSRRICF